MLAHSIPCLPKSWHWSAMRLTRGEITKEMCLLMQAEAPGQAAGGAVANSDTEMKQLYRCIYVDVSFVKSIIGIIMAFEIILSLLGLIIVSASYIEACDFLYGKTYSYFDFVTASCFFTSGAWYILNALGVLKKFGVIRWDIGELIWCGFYTFNFLISSSVLAAHSCYQESYKAGAAFGFFCLIVIAGHGIWELKRFFDKRRQSSSSQSRGHVYEDPPVANAAVEDDSKY
ncbi:hypothetical protein ACJMK2_010421 [Sinanodonta woodiana]|uniref:MARVEL domain-containing protein n=1 Tax=Sinanodonta woodiana TaxID=1069815 RepID=A0ABD3VFB1_SINWO